MLEKLKKNGLAGKGCSIEEAHWLATEAEEQALFQAATAIREAFFGRRIQLCSIINAKSGKCDMDCRFCSQSGHNTTEIEEYPFLPAPELEQHIRTIIRDNNRHCGVVTAGGKLSGSELTRLAEVIKKISGGQPAPICASLGRLSQGELLKLKAAGMVRFHHNLEASEAYYPSICSTQTWQQRLATVRAAMEAQLEVCCGGLFGLGERWEDRIALASALRDIGIDSVPINFLYPHEGTPLKHKQSLSPAEALRIIAVYRFMLPRATLRICGGRMHVLADRQNELFAAGANGMMTGNYLTVSGSLPTEDLQMIQSLGLEIESTCH
jgi:biotin synthase